MKENKMGVEDNRYCITVTYEQAQLIVKSLDLYSRILIGQIGEITWVLSKERPGELSEDTRRMMDSYLSNIRPMLEEDIFKHERPRCCDLGYEMLKVIDKQLYDDEREGDDNGYSISVRSDGPIKYTDAPLIEIKKEN